MSQTVSVDFPCANTAPIPLMCAAVMMEIGLLMLKYSKRVFILNANMSSFKTVLVLFSPVEVYFSLGKLVKDV